MMCQEPYSSVTSPNYPHKENLSSNPPPSTYYSKKKERKKIAIYNPLSLVIVQNNNRSAVVQIWKLKSWSIALLSWHLQCIIVTKTMVENSDWIFFSILLAILSYGYQATSILIVHVYCNWHPVANSYQFNIQDYVKDV